MSAKNPSDATPDMDTLRSDLEHLRENLTTISSTVSALAGEMGSDAGKRLHAGADEVKARAQRATRSVEHTVAEQPLISLLAAFVVGLVLGIFFGRR